MDKNPWIFYEFNIKNYYNGPFILEIVLSKQDIRGGFNLGRERKQAFVIIKDINLKSKDRLYWKEVFNSIWNCRKKWNVKIPHHKIIDIIKRIKLDRYQERLPKRKTWEDRYGKNVVQWALNIIETAVDDSCMDNYRLAKVSDKRALKVYREQQENGCCGFYDIVKRCPYDFFREYHIGFNYGH